MGSKVSIIVPVFNSERYLRACLDSVLSQKYSDYEIVCVNDGSTDESEIILSHYVQADPRIKSIYQENQGLSGARNTGMSLATGKYILFLDSDDILADEALGNLVQAAEQYQADIVYFDADSFFEGESLAEKYGFYREFYKRNGCIMGPCSGIEMLVDLERNGCWWPSACLQLFNLAFLRNSGLSFIPGVLHEDNAFSFECALEAQTVAREPHPYYRRRVHAESIMTHPKTHRNVIGLYTCYLRSLKALNRHPDIEDEEVYQVASSALFQAKDVLSILDITECKEALNAFSGDERALLWTILEDTRRSNDEKTILRNERNCAKTELNEILESRSYQLSDCLARVYRKILRK